MNTGGPTLLYDLNVAYDAGERRNPLRVMRELGIKWMRSEAEPIRMLHLDTSLVAALSKATVR
jgi:hypothetical protein